MALTTYDELKAAVANWLNRDDLTATIPDFISLAESRIARRLRVAEMEKTMTAYLTSGAVALPPDFEEARRIHSSAAGAYATALQPLSPSQAGDRYPTSQSGVPIHYTITGNTLSTYPNGGSGQVTMTYYARPPALAAYGTNWLLAKAPDVYLYGALLEAAPFLGDDQRTATWASLFDRACDALQSADQRTRYSSSVSRFMGETP